MTDRTILLVTAIALLCCSPSRSSAQNSQPVDARVETGRIDQSVLVLNGPWRFRTGDDPRWADPNLDDSGWELYRIGSERESPGQKELPQSNLLPGWQAQGHPGYSGYAWYRIRVRPWTDGRLLSLLMPENVEDSYEVYVNGEKIGAFGRLDSPHLYYVPRPLTFALPQSAQQQEHPLTLAIRFWNRNVEARSRAGNVRGGLRDIPLLGSRDLLESIRQNQQIRLHDELQSILPLLYLFGAVSLISFFLFALTPSRREYLWAGISLSGVSLSFMSQTADVTLLLPVQFQVLCQCIGEWIGLSAGPVFVMYLLNVDKRLWRRIAWVVCGLLLARTVFLTADYADVLPQTAGWSWVPLIAPIALLSTVALVSGIVVDGVRTIGRRALAPLSPGLLAACGLIVHLIARGSADYSDAFFAGVPVALVVVFLWRFTEQQRENERNAIDLGEAQQVQRLLLSAQLPQVPGFEIESAYLPAREVGGDFLQVVEGNAGAMTIVFGDVAGKGFPAAMLVSMLVGVIRTCEVQMHDPASILGILNDRLCGAKVGGFATCMAAQISAATGAVQMANAGHLAPYLNGKEIALQGSLPLGISGKIDFETHAFQLEPGDRLMITSDGVLEAMNGRKELFGFERLSAISMQPASQIAGTAQQFGQEDDITVLTIHRTAARA